MKGPGTSSQFPALSHKHVRNVGHTAYYNVWQNLILIVLTIQKKLYKCNFHYVAMPMMTSQILKSVDFTKIPKSRYLENETIFFSSNKKNH